jgi:hypothetical protein
VSCIDDDIIPFAANEDEFVVNVRDIFSRLRQFQIKIHPKKATLGVSKIIVVGHEMTKDGITMTDQRIDVVAKMP